MCDIFSYPVSRGRSKSTPGLQNKLTASYPRINFGLNNNRVHTHHSANPLIDGEELTDMNFTGVNDSVPHSMYNSNDNNNGDVTSRTNKKLDINNTIYGYNNAKEFTNSIDKLNKDVNIYFTPATPTPISIISGK